MMYVLAVACLLLVCFSPDLTVSLGPKQDVEFTFLLSAGRTECFFQPTMRGDSVEFEYQLSQSRRGLEQLHHRPVAHRPSQGRLLGRVTVVQDSGVRLDHRVIAGSGLDVGFSLISPSGHRLVSDFRKSNAIHMVDPAEDGDYRLCFDNSFSKMSEKMVYFEVILNSQSGTTDEWEGATEDSLVEYQLKDIRASMETVHGYLEKTRQVQAVLRAFEARDRYLLEDNLWRISFWSCLTLLVMLGVASAQIYTLRRLFDDNKRERTKA